jgi:hypothetical protein
MLERVSEVERLFRPKPRAHQQHRSLEGDQNYYKGKQNRPVVPGDGNAQTAIAGEALLNHPRHITGRRDRIAAHLRRTHRKMREDSVYQSETDSSAFYGTWFVQEPQTA